VEPTGPSHSGFLLSQLLAVRRAAGGPEPERGEDMSDGPDRRAARRRAARGGSALMK
jgi:hypothetical protein